MSNQAIPETNTGACVLTDDEVVALAIDADGAWPLPLPTISTWDVDELGRSAVRGWRSLALRGGLTEDGTALQALAPVLGAASATATLVLFLGDEGAQPITWDFSYGAVRTDDGWLLDEITAGGIHRLWRVKSTDDIVNFMTTALGEVHVSGLPALADREGMHLYLAATDASGSRMTGVKRESVTEVSTDSDGRIVSQETAQKSLSDSVRDLIAAWL